MNDATQTLGNDLKMKTADFFPCNVSTRCLALALALVPMEPTIAGDKLEPPAAVVENKPAGYDLQIVGGQLILPQGQAEATLPRVVDALRDQYPQANIVLSPGLSKAKVGDLKLRASRLNEELEAVRVASGEKFEVQEVHSANPAIDPNTGLPRAGDRSLNAGLFILREVRPPAQMQRVVEAFNIGPYLEGQRHQPREAGVSDGQVEDKALREIEEIIVETLDSFHADGDAPNQAVFHSPSFQYHHGATLLILIGNQESVEIARKIVNALPGMSSVAYGLAPAVNSTAAERANDAFRARYGLPPRPASSGQTAVPAPDSGAAK